MNKGAESTEAEYFMQHHKKIRQILMYYFIKKGEKKKKASGDRSHTVYDLCKCRRFFSPIDVVSLAYFE